jgi:hypothetical protein
MERITDAWDGLGRRERALAIVAVVVLLLVVIAFILFGGSEPTAPVDASTASVADAAARAEGEVPAMVVTEAGTPLAAPTGSTAKGVAGLAVAGGGGGAGNDTGVGPGNDPLIAEADEHYVQEAYDEGAYKPPIVSEAVKAAGRDLERVAAEYQACMAKAHASNTDSRHCMNDTLKYGVGVAPGGLHRDDGLTLVKQSSDGHELQFTTFPAPKPACRILDKGKSCNAWVSN